MTLDSTSSSSHSSASKATATIAPGEAGSDGGFAALGLSPSLLEAVRVAGYDVPTPIQRSAIPHVAAGRDLLGCAQTGTGKTAAFALPILQRLASVPAPKRPVVRALVLAPTRELAAQIGQSFATYGRRSGLRHLVVFGGVSKLPQSQALRRGVDLLVATPGRLLDLMGDRVVSLDQVEIFVLDEADRMLDMGFLPDVRRIAREIPRKRQTLLFSATMPREIESLAASLQSDPVRVAVDKVSSTGAPIAQSVYFVDKRCKPDLLARVLADPTVDRALVFTRTKHGANRVADKLDRAGVAVAAIHGNKSQSARERALRDFKSGRVRVVVATDVAARGIDVKELSHVINYDLPVEPESYVHRVGRTGRAGLSGTALSFCAPEERSSLAAIERLGGARIERRELPEGLQRSVDARPEAASRAPRPRSRAGSSARGPARGRDGRRRAFQR